MIKLPVYMDHHATTPVDPRVLDAMLPALREDFGNASSPHHLFGRRAKRIVDEGRASVASLIGAAPEEILFTSGATESNNLALKGVMRLHRDRGNHLITCVTEHASVLETAEQLALEGFKVTFLPVGADGRIRIKDLEAAITPQTALISIMAANNEIGTLQPIREIGRIARARGILFHTDATQAAAWMPIDTRADQIDLLSFSAHKMYGPKGIGALFVRRDHPHVRLEPLFEGGGHEEGLRPGTLNVPGIAGFGRAAELVRAERSADARRVTGLRDHLYQSIVSRLTDVRVSGPDPSDTPASSHRLPNNLNLSFAYIEGESLLKSFDSIALSSSSACTSANLEVSYVLKALGLPAELVHASIRFGLGRFNTLEEVNYTADEVVRVVTTLRDRSTLYQIAKAGAGEFKLARLPGAGSGPGGASSASNKGGACKK